MKIWIATLSTLLFAAILGTSVAHSHRSTFLHAHPHLQTIDSALLANNALALIAVGLFAVAGVTLSLARRRK